MQVDWEGDLRTQSVVMGVTITKFIVLKSLNLTNLLTSEEYGSTTTFGGDDNLKFSTRTAQSGAKDTFHTINVNNTKCVSFTRICQIDFSDTASTSNLIQFHSNVTKTTFTVTFDGYLYIYTRSILSTRIQNADFFDLTRRCNIRNNWQFRVESTSRNQFDIINRTDCLQRCCGVVRIKSTLFIKTNLSIGKLGFMEKWESKLSVANYARNRKCAIIRCLNNVNKRLGTNWRVCTSSRWIKVVCDIGNFTANCKFNNWCFSAREETRSSFTLNHVKGVFQLKLVILRERQIVTKVRGIAKIKNVRMVSNEQQSWVLGGDFYTRDCTLQELRIRICNCTHLVDEISRREDFFNKERSSKLRSSESFYEEDISYIKSMRR